MRFSNLEPIPPWDFREKKRENKQEVVREVVYMMVRQGDLLIVKIEKIPQDAKKRDTLVLAEGEATGHLHELDTGEVYGKGPTLYFSVPEDKIVTLTHPEHKSLTFESGEYKVIRQREYESVKPRQVRD